jgi:hypothetical protein
MIQLIRRIAAVALVGATLIASPALAVTWVTYAPDADGYRYWIDKDSLQTKGGYIYYSWLLLTPDDPTPTAASSARQSAIDCATGDSLKLENGAWVTGPHFTDEAYLFRFVCKK